jgi:predicted HNH restriction endonuclease
MPYKDRETRIKKQREYSRRWYLKNTERAKKDSEQRRRGTKARWLAYRAKQSCAHCGFSHPAVIDFHHIIRDGKRSVNDLAVKQNNVREAIQEAEEKCIPLCANCHRILHFDERQRIRAGRKKKS